jgi:hypothetical protein
MDQNSFDKCVTSILSDIVLRKSVDYGDKKSVRKYNAAYGRMKKNAIYINTNYSDRVDELFALTNNTDTEIAYAVACLIISHIECPSTMKRAAIAVVKKLFEEGKTPKLSELTLPSCIMNWERIYPEASDDSAVDS